MWFQKFDVLDIEKYSRYLQVFHLYGFYLSDVLKYAEEVIVMDKGKLLYHTSPSELFEKYSNKLEILGLELPECISFLNKLNQKLKVPIKISEDIKEESILKVIEEKIKYKRKEQ